MNFLRESGQMIFAASLLLCTPLAAGGQESPGKSPEAFKNRFAELAGRITIAPAGHPDKRFLPLPQPALSWSNPARQTTAGAMFLWTAAGRPQVALCAYPNGEQVIDLEFQSLSEHPLAGNIDAQQLWQPGEGGVHWKSLPDAPHPARTPNQLLRQMRSIARAFSAKLVPPNKNPIELRLLETPVYRYDLSKKPANADDDTNARLIDGAVLTFVQGTDPEVLLLLEAVDGANGRTWRYALARMSIVPTQVYHQNSLVWETQWAIHRADTPYFVYKSF